jgi:hypothetical protein
MKKRLRESTTTRKAGGLDFTAIGGKRQGSETPQSLKITRLNRVCVNDHTALSAGWFGFSSVGRKTSEHQFAIIAFVIGCPAPGLYTNNHPVWKTQSLNKRNFMLLTGYSDSATFSKRG